jgi:hypothetical protein
MRFDKEAALRHSEAVKKLGQAPSRPLIFQRFRRFRSEPVPFFHRLSPSSAWLLAVVLISASGASCPTRQPPGVAAPAAFMAPPTVADVLRAVNTNNSRINQLQADNARLTIQGVPPMRASVALQRPRDFRLRAQFVGLGEVLDLGSNQEVFWALIDAPQMATNITRGIYYARHDQFVSGQAAEILPIRPDWLVDAFGLPILDAAHAHEGPWQRGADQLEIRSRIPTPAGETGRITVVHATYGWVLEQHTYDPRGAVFRVLFLVVALGCFHRFTLFASLPAIWWRWCWKSRGCSCACRFGPLWGSGLLRPDCWLTPSTWSCEVVERRVPRPLFPAGTIGFLLAAWGVAAVYLVTAVRRPQAALGIFMLPVVLVLVGVAYLFQGVAPFPRDRALMAWAMIHGVTLLLGVVAAALGFVAGVMYLVHSYRLKHKLPPRQGLRLPSLEWLQNANKRALIVSPCLVGLGLLAGVVMNLLKFDQAMAWTDPVVWTSGLLLLWLMMVFVFEVSYKPAQQGRKVAYLTVASFLFLGFVLAIVLWVPSGHASPSTQDAAAPPSAEGPYGDGGGGR